MTYTPTYPHLLPEFNLRGAKHNFRSNTYSMFNKEVNKKMNNNKNNLSKVALHLSEVASKTGWTHSSNFTFLLREQLILILLAPYVPGFVAAI